MLEYVWADGHETWAPYRDGLRYVLGDRSEAMRFRQSEALADLIELDRAEVRPIDATALEWDGPFRGRDRGQRAARRAGRTSACGWVVTARSCGCTSSRPRHGLRELEVPLSWGWFDEQGEVEPFPEQLGPYLARVLPMVDEVRDTGYEPADLYWAPALPGTIARLAEILRRPDSLGVAIIIDYGDSTMDGIDTDESRLRVYGDDQVHGVDPYRSPGRSDLTWDVDYGEVGRLARANGLRVRFAGPQGALEVPPVDLASLGGARPARARSVRRGRRDPGPRPGRGAAAGHRVPGRVERLPRDDARRARRTLPRQRVRPPPASGLTLSRRSR